VGYKKRDAKEMKNIVKVLLAQRSDGTFLRLDEQDPNATSFDYVVNPELATQIKPSDERDFKKPKGAPYYFENSYRAREIWLKDCKMVAYVITTTVDAIPV